MMLYFCDIINIQLFTRAYLQALRLCVTRVGGDFHSCQDVQEEFFLRLSDPEDARRDTVGDLSRPDLSYVSCRFNTKGRNVVETHTA
jgi:hypothetical protein